MNNIIVDMFQPKCFHRHTARTHPNCFDADGNPVQHQVNRSANILIFDVETLPILGYSWGVWNQNIYDHQIKKDWCVLSYSAKWFGDDKIISDILTPKEAVNRDDGRLVGGFWRLLNDAHIVVTHNGKRFDIRKLNTRFWKNKIHKPSSYKVIDTLTTAKSVFGLTFNSLDFIAKFIGAQQKLDTDFPLWIACDNGDKEALNKMSQYNEQDVRTQEEIYLNMREWIPNHPDLRIYGNKKDVCPVCLSDSHKKIGIYVAEKKSYPEYRCNNCNSIWHDTKSEKEQ